jgi:hypothetical protein
MKTTQLIDAVPETGLRHGFVGLTGPEILRSYAEDRSQETKVSPWHARRGRFSRRAIAGCVRQPTRPAVASGTVFECLPLRRIQCCFPNGGRIGLVRNAGPPHFFGLMRMSAGIRGMVLTLRQSQLISRSQVSEIRHEKHSPAKTSPRASQSKDRHLGCCNPKPDSTMRRVAVHIRP